MWNRTVIGMVSGKVAMEAYPMERTAKVLLTSNAFEVKIFGKDTQLVKTLQVYPDEKYRVHVYVPVFTDAGKEFGAKNFLYHKISRSFDTYEQAREVYDYITSNLRFEEITPFARWKFAVFAFDMTTHEEIDVV